MRFETLLAFALPLLADAQRTIYVDKTCSDRTDWQVYLDEALNSAKYASARLGNTADTDFEAVVKRIFKVDRSNADGFKAVKDVIDEIAGITMVSPSTDLKGSNTRFFCDDDPIGKKGVDADKDVRWQHQINPNGGYLNYFDQVNNMKQREASSPSCNNPLKPNRVGRTYRIKAPEPKKPTSPFAGHNSNRNVITLCNTLFDIKGVPLKIADLDKDLEGSAIDMLSDLVSHTILHELAHAVRDDIADVQPDPYGYTEILAKNAEDAIKNADNFAFLAIFAQVMELNYSIPRLTFPAGTSDADKAEAEEDCQKGYLTYLPDITKRIIAAAKMLARLFWA
ncbi:uncharacterized protein BDZ99DRAFT_495230 [Mytilinidion resinicola]|uniref:Lysine-specific metallo-endopeptidase domain-containing protein n=1 Tax=Mytilinidion resinicola TaxID=574789 RepID=A0A6A6Z5K6_9PEZI|nr:uncharacterized protein BDZ99DRAFT_495230 [Mytilinidion resinicola]KAF2815485.1 hypothetical protein BDZ99DRAFT_495230 [Mytilinidion resinicola]